MLAKIDVNRKDRFSSLQKKANRKTYREEIRAGQEQMASLVFRMEANQAKTDLNLKEMRDEIKSGQAEMISKRRWGAAIHSIQTELEETIRHRMEDGLSCVDQKTQGLSNEPTETQVELLASTGHPPLCPPTPEAGQWPDENWLRYTSQLRRLPRGRQSMALSSNPHEGGNLQSSILVGGPVQSSRPDK
jgi:hypothetical protein